MATRRATEKPLALFVPEGFTDFQCGRCGACCHEPPRITVSAAKYERLARALRDAEFAFPSRDALMKDDDDPEAPATFARVGEQCVFLTDQGRCRLCELGVPELRGAWCIAFPVSPLVTPRGVNYSISFACPKTARMLRRRKPLNILAMTVASGRVPSAERPLTPQHRIPIRTEGPKLDWAAHRLVEGMLLATARDWEISLTDRLIVMPILLGHLLRDYAGPESNAQLRERVSHAAQKLADLVAAARPLRPHRDQHYEALAGFFGRRIGLRTKTALRKTVDLAMSQVRHRRGKTNTAGLAKALGDLYRSRYKPRASRVEHILGNYVICRLFASREMLTRGLYRGLYAVLYRVALARFFATTTAAERDTRVDPDILIEAVQTVEKLFGENRTAFDFLDSDGEQERMLDPAYAAALVRL